MAKEKSHNSLQKQIDGIMPAESVKQNDERPVAIRLSGVKKQYRLGAIGGRTLQADLQSWWAKKRGREDPNLRIGTDSRQFGEIFMALNGIDLTVYRGERLGIIGANGAGKSTMLKLLARVTAPTEGEIDIWGRISSMLEVGTGFNGELTGRENIYMNGAILGMSKSEIDARIEEIIDFSEVREFIDTPIKRYSSGMYVKLGFAVAAHLKSEIMIMDEVLAVGDMAFQSKCLERMRKAADDEGKTILYVSHNMTTIRNLCERCIVMDQGKIIFDGDVETAISVYMDHCLDENRVDMDLKKMTHQQPKSKPVTMTHLLLPEKVTPVYEENEPLRFLLRINAVKSIENVLFRLTLRTDTDVGLGTSWSRPITVHEGEQELLLEMPSESVAKGIFYGSIGLYQKDEIGRNILLDHISRAFKIEFLGKPNWYPTAYGYIRLPEMVQKKGGE